MAWRLYTGSIWCPFTTCFLCCCTRCWGSLEVYFTSIVVTILPRFHCNKYSIYTAQSNHVTSSNLVDTHMPHSNHVTSSKSVDVSCDTTTMHRDYIHILFMYGDMMLWCLKVVPVAYSSDVIPWKNSSKPAFLYCTLLSALLSPTQCCRSLSLETWISRFGTMFG